MSNQTHSLISKKACEGLGLIKPHTTLVQKVKSETNIDFRQEVKPLFQGLDKLKNPYHIKLQLDAKTHMPLYAHLTKVKVELDAMV